MTYEHYGDMARNHRAGGQVEPHYDTSAKPPVGGNDNGPKYMEYGDFFKTRLEVTKAYSEGAKGFVQLSSAALALPLVFTQTILGKDVADKGLPGLDGIVLWTLGLAWASFFFAIVCGSFYLWLAPRRMWDDLHRNPEHFVRYSHLFIKWPTGRTFDDLNRSIPYGFMIAFFCAGALGFVLYASHAIGLWGWDLLSTIAAAVSALASEVAAYLGLKS
jgi:hypothetical protein